MVIDDKDSFLARFATEITSQIRVLGLGREHIGPGADKRLSIDLLVTFCSCRRIGAPSRTLIMNDFAERLIENLVAMLPDPERQVGILIVGWCVSRIETADALKERFRDHGTRGRTVIDITEVVVFRLPGIIEFAVVPSRAVLPDYSPCLLEASVGKEQLRPHQANSRLQLKGLEQRIEPARLHGCVVIQ